MSMSSAGITRVRHPVLSASGQTLFHSAIMSREITVSFCHSFSGGTLPNSGSGM
jgi:hypothetical protein